MRSEDLGGRVGAEGEGRSLVHSRAGLAKRDEQPPRDIYGSWGVRKNADITCTWNPTD